MFKVKNAFLRMIEKDGKRGWSGSLADWNLAGSYELTFKSIKAMENTCAHLIAKNRTFKEIWH